MLFRSRGMRPALIDTVLRYADIETPIGNHRVAVRLSADQLDQLRQDHGPSFAERAKDVVVVLVGAVVVTVLHAVGAAGRRYRHP